LRRALDAALRARNFEVARRAVSTLALDAYGNHSPKEAFECLALQQSVEVYARATELFDEVMPLDHEERILLRQLAELRSRWQLPEELASYRSMSRRLMDMSPMVKRLQLAELPPVPELLSIYLPANTLVITFQLHERFLYVGAAVSAGADIPPEERPEQTRYHVMRVPLEASVVQTRMQKLNEINSAAEKELIMTVALTETYAQHYEIICEELDRLFQPIMQVLELKFFSLGVHMRPPEKNENPTQLILLPDPSLSQFPLERFPSLARLVGPKNVSAISRDASLHLYAMRLKYGVQADGPPSAPTGLPETLSAFSGDKTKLLSDPFAEDALKQAEDPEGESMCELHKRIVESGGAGDGLHGEMWTTSPEDIVKMLQDCQSFLFLGFGRFLTTMPARVLASQNLSHLPLLALFSRAINDAAFRRQTKVDSMKTQRQLMVEGVYETALLCAFRGVQCTVHCANPLAIAQVQRAAEVFANGLKEAGTVGAALETLLNLETADTRLRYSRLLKSGQIPTKVYEVPGSQAKAEGEEQTEPKPGDLFLFHSKASFVCYGIASVKRT